MKLPSNVSIPYVDTTQMAEVDRAMVEDWIPHPASIRRLAPRMTLPLKLPPP